MKRRIYLDTSAYVAALVNDDRAAAIRASVEQAEVMSSVLLLAETQRTLVRLTREGHLLPEHYALLSRQLEIDTETFALCAVTFELCAATAMPIVTTPRTLDLLHLRTALWFHRRAPLDGFLSLDAQQNHAANELGLPLLG